MTSLTSAQTVQLGPAGPTVPALGIGTWAWGDSLFWQYGKDYGEEEVRQAFQAAIAAGVNFFDTAEVYGLGKSETLLGRFMQEQDQPVSVATKYFPVPWRFSARSVAQALSASLDRLQVTSIALYQIHWPFSFFLSQRSLMQALAQEVQKGRIQAVGVSNYSAAQMRAAHRFLADQGVPLAVNQMQYSLLHRNIETNGVLAAARDLGVTILAYSPLAQGLLTGKYTADAPKQPTGARSLSPKFQASYLRRIEPLIQAMTDIGAKYDRTPAQVALNWLIAQGNLVPIPGAKNAKQAAQNAGALGWQLSPAEVAHLAQILV
ncbi:aldo/keto reductase [Lyngbya confervoides]|uniref:Aldo/keto reductase n=1 Tax=Lyngbya confervoides BDU141951 TaxID=1574623 RepID=A0ABD4T0J4_9CYAN|nr:aldo/keto reductase [Lyngbya confervoides]MCM1981941.1 aldo/keto reductase [Lyngbya confervoides BDU141951]